MTPFIPRYQRGYHREQVSKSCDISAECSLSCAADIYGETFQDPVCEDFSLLFGLIDY